MFAPLAVRAYLTARDTEQAPASRALLLMERHIHESNTAIAVLYGTRNLGEIRPSFLDVPSPENKFLVGARKRNSAQPRAHS
jgi:hypothetical protein